MATRDDLVSAFRRKAAGAQIRKQTTGPRAGQDFYVKQGASGLPVRVYETGDTALASGAFPGVPGAQRQKLARRKRAGAVSAIVTSRKLSGY